MTPIADMVEKMLSGGIPPEFIVLAIKTAEQCAQVAIGEDPVAARRRAYDRERKRNSKEECTEVISTGIPPEERPKEIPSTPPKENYLTSFSNSKDEEKKEVSKRIRAREIEGLFGLFCIEYPKREGSDPKKPALKLFEQAIKSGHDPKLMIAAASHYRIECAEKGIGGAYIAQKQTWLRQSRFLDYSAPAPSEAAGPPQPPSPDLPSDEELRRRYEQLPAESGDLRESSSCPLRETERRGEEGACPSDDPPRKPGMERLGAILPRLSGLRADCDENLPF